VLHANVAWPLRFPGFWVVLVSSSGTFRRGIGQSQSPYIHNPTQADVCIYQPTLYAYLPTNLPTYVFAYLLTKIHHTKLPTYQPA
jgi:hypothetical protein